MKKPTASSAEHVGALVLRLQTDLAKQAMVVVTENVFLLDRKQQDYGPHNLTKFGVYGVVVRANDKMERIVNLLKREQAGGSSEAQNESVADSFLDLANYAVIGYLLHTKRWPRS